MFKNVLRRNGFWCKRASGGDTFLKHDSIFGGIYVTLEKKWAVLKIVDRDIIHVFRSAKQLEDYLKGLEEREPPSIIRQK
ncbi:MAG: hypothetical protein ACUVXA_06845 [Candidatus Jordarchaeum sp.]|uniref:hypothetical protein n=1 Tax=Candidatus Jordarchaeum sp. TaxID=2823881 RepID=UPI0040494CBA